MSSPPPPEQLSPPPASPLVAMLHYAISPGARVTMFITCLVLIAALQYPLLLSLFRKSGNGIIDPSEIEQWNGGGEIERTKILAALSALSKYKTRMAETFSKKRKEYNKLKPHQKLVRI